MSVKKRVDTGFSMWYFEVGREGVRQITQFRERKRIDMKKKKGKKSGKLRIETRSMSHGDVIREIVDSFNEDREDDKLPRKDVKEIIALYHNIILGEVQDNGVFAIPGIVKLVRKFKPARERRKGINPFTGKKQWFEAKPATYVAKARPLTKVKLAARNEN